MTPPNHNRMSHIDSIRGIAALLVLFQHVCRAFVYLTPEIKAQGTLLYDISHYLNFGSVGVTAFFAISGFVICPSLKGQRSAGARSFIIKRFFRLFPAFWTAILLTLLTSFVLKGLTIDWLQVLGNMPMLYSVTGVKPLEPLFWTLEVELVFYFLCLILFLCGWLHKPLMLFFVGLAFLAIGELLQNRFEFRMAITEALNFHWKGLPYYLAIMFWGGLFRAWHENRQEVCTVFGYQVPIIVLVVSLLFLIVLRSLIALDLWIYKGDVFKMAAVLPLFLGLGLFIVCTLYVKLENSFFVWLGSISYSIYLLHPVVFIPVQYFVVQNRLIWGDMHLSIYLLFCTILTLILADLVYRFVEKPAIQLGRHLQNR